MIVEHGERVEIGDGWAVEGVWDGDFVAGAFHESEVFWGSGLRISARGVEVVPSIALTDRVFAGRHGDEWIASNSLPLILGLNGLGLLPHRSYMPESYAIRRGVLDYVADFPVRGDARIHQIVHRNAVLRDAEITRPVRSTPRQFADFASYVAAIGAAVEGIASNLSSPARRHRMTPAGTASSGYDSACAAVFARRAGAESVFTVPRSNSSYPTLMRSGVTDDSGAEIVDHLGLRAVFLSARPTEREVYFRSGSCVRPEVALDGVHDEKGTTYVLFTGFYGDTVWGRSPPGRVPDSELRWPHPSGISASEGRLAAGFINLALPFLYGRSRPAVEAISSSSDMAPWSIGGEYDRPIPRRILEEAGVPRRLFGHRKKAIVDSHSSPLNPAARASFLEWLHRTKAVTPAQYRARQMMAGARFMARAAFELAGQSIGHKVRRTPPEQMWPEHLRPDELMFQWAVDTLAARYAAR